MSEREAAANDADERLAGAYYAIKLLQRAVSVEQYEKLEATKESILAASALVRTMMHPAVRKDTQWP